MKRSIVTQLVAQARERRGLLSESDAVRLTGRSDALRLLLRSGMWQEVLPSVLVAATLKVTREVVEDAVALWDPSARLGFYSAARRSGIWVPDHPDAWAVVAFGSRKRSLPGLQVRRTRAPATTYVKDGHSFWTPPARTLADLSPLLTAKQFDAALLNAIRNDKVDADQVVAELNRLTYRPGTAEALARVALWTPARETQLEDRFVPDLEAVVGAENVRRQHAFRSDGRTVRFDAAVPELMLAFEADGYFFHSTDEQLAADQERDRWALGKGWLTVRFREDVIGNSPVVRRQIRAIVDRRPRDRAA